MQPTYPPIPSERSVILESEIDETVWYIFEDLNMFFEIFIDE